MQTEDNKWHWAEANKYALEAMKTLLLLNGGSAVALLAFVGNLKGTGGAATLPAIGSAMLCFGLGALCAARRNPLFAIAPLPPSRRLLMNASRLRPAMQR